MTIFRNGNRGDLYEPYRFRQLLGEIAGSSLRPCNRRRR
jgi:hypothetical protein